MGLIADTTSQIDTILTNYVADAFSALAAPMDILFKSVLLVSLVFLAINNVVQFKQINFATYLHWGIRGGVIFSFLFIWSNFEFIYTLLTEIPNDYVAILLKIANQGYLTHRTDILDPSRITDTNTALDEFGHAMVWIAYDYIRDTSISDIGMSLRNVFFGVLILIIGGIFLAAGLIIMIVAKIGLALSLSLAPLAIVALMMEQTKPHFESWSRFTVGFAVVPLLMGAMMALVLYVASFMLVAGNGGSHNKPGYLAFILVMLAAMVLLFQLPTMASTLASASVAAVGGGAAFAAASMAKRGVMSPASKLYGLGSATKNMASTAKQARSAGASKRETMGAVFRSMRQSSGMRSARRDQRLAGGIKGDSKPKPNAQPTPKSSGGGSSGGSGSSGGRQNPEQQNQNRA